MKPWTLNPKRPSTEIVLLVFDWLGPLASLSPQGSMLPGTKSFTYYGLSQELKVQL